MRKMLALAPVLFLLAAPATAFATGGDRPAMTAGTSSFELFGTKFCFGPAQGCDVTFAPQDEMEAELTMAAPSDGRHVVSFFGVTFCGEPHATGPACDVAWVPPAPYAPWRDQPEIRLLAEIDRYR